MTPKECLSLENVLNACLESDNEESDLEIDSKDSLNEDSSKEINLPQLIKNFDEEKAVLIDSVFLTPTLLLHAADCIPAPATTTFFFVPKFSKTSPKRICHHYKLLFFIEFFHKFNFEHFYNLLITSGRIIYKP